METLSFYVTKDGKPPNEIINAMRNRWRDLSGKHVNWTLREVVKKRSNNQNDFWWGVCIPIIQSAFAERGEVITPSEAHDIVVSCVWKLTKIVNMPNGEKCESRRSSTELTTSEWEEKIELTRAYFSQYNIIIPFPNEEITP